ncbi:50S ribosomal protein L6, chloroplastic, partial [Linum perenne]
SPTPIRRVNFARTVVECKESRIGKQPIPVPGNVTIKLEEQYFEVKGPLGQLSRSYPPEVKLVMDENGVIRVIKGFEKRLQLVGVGYRGTLEGNDLVLNLGFSHPVRMKIPDNLKVKVEENTRIIISGYDKCDIGLFAASIRRWRPPEPYKGKGVRYANEVVKLKEGKAGKKK